MNSSNTALVVATYDGIFISVDSSHIKYSSGAKFIIDIPKRFKNVKAVILSVFDYEPIGFDSNGDFCEAIKEMLNLLEIPSYFDAPKNSSLSLALIAENITVDINDTVLHLLSSEGKNVIIIEYCFTENGYQEINFNRIPIDLKESPKNVREKIIGSTNPKKIILISQDTKSEACKFLSKAINSNDLIIMNEPTVQSSINHRNELSKWLFDKSFVKYHVIPTTVKRYFMHLNKTTVLAEIPYDHVLPCEKSVILPRSIADLYHGYLEIRSNNYTIESGQMNKYCHKNKYVLSVDAENFIEIKQESIMYPEIKALPQNLKKFDKKIPVIAILNEISFICIWENGGYKFADSWDGIYGKEMALTFDQQNPRVCNDMLKSYLKKPTSVVYDLIKIMSLPTEKVDVNEMWKFSILNNNLKYSTLINYESTNGTMKIASLSYLMSLILKEQLNAIKKEIKKQPTEIGICILDDFKPDERKRVEKGFEKACEFLNINCTFLNV